MRIILHIWRQPSPNASGRMVRYEVPNLARSPDRTIAKVTLKVYML